MKDKKPAHAKDEAGVKKPPDKNPQGGRAMMRSEIYGKTLRFFLVPVADLLYEDESVTEVLINGASSIYCERGGRLGASSTASPMSKC